jgi:hypothetical protein
MDSGLGFAERRALGQKAEEFLLPGAEGGTVFGNVLAPRRLFNVASED